MAVDGQTQLQTPSQGPQSRLLAFVLTLALFSLVSLLVLSPPTRLLRRIHRLATRPVARLLGRIPVPSALQAPTDLAVAIRSFSQYSHAQQNALSRKWVAFERMPRRHRTLGTKLGWEKTLERAEEAVETNALVTDELAALGLEQARRDGVPVGLRSHFYHENGRVVEVCSCRLFLLWSSPDPFARACNASSSLRLDAQTFREGLERGRQG